MGKSELSRSMIDFKFLTDSLNFILHAATLASPSSASPSDRVTRLLLWYVTRPRAAKALKDSLMVPKLLNVM